MRKCRPITGTCAGVTCGWGDYYSKPPAAYGPPPQVPNAAPSTGQDNASSRGSSVHKVSPNAAFNASILVVTQCLKGAGSGCMTVCIWPTTTLRRGASPRWILRRPATPPTGTGRSLSRPHVGAAALPSLTVRTDPHVVWWQIQQAVASAAGP